MVWTEPATPIPNKTLQPQGGGNRTREGFPPRPRTVMSEPKIAEVRMTTSASYALGKKIEEGPLSESIQSRIDRLLKPGQ